MPNSYYLAQINIALTKYPLDNVLMKDFVDGIAPINSLADKSKGFVWRFVEQEGQNTGLEVFGDNSIIVNFSVWETLEDFKNFVYKSFHSHYLQRKKEWFEKMKKSHYTMWWIPKDKIPPLIEEARDKLLLFQQKGATKEAFSLKQVFPTPP